MKCKVCGYEFDSDRAYCPMCGSKTEEELRNRTNDEMSWDTYDFPKPKMPKDIEMNWPEMPIPTKEHITVMKKDATEGFVTTASDDIQSEPELPETPSYDYWKESRQRREQLRSEPVRKGGKVVAELPEKETEFTPASKPAQGAWRMPEMQPEPSRTIFSEEAFKAEPSRQLPPQAEPPGQAAQVFAQPVFIPQYPDKMQIAWTIPPQSSGQPVYLAQPAQPIYITTTPPGYREMQTQEEGEERLAFGAARREDFGQRYEEASAQKQASDSTLRRTETLAPRRSAADIFEGKEPEHYARMLKEKIVARAKEAPEDPLDFKESEFADLEPDEDGRFSEKFFTFHKKNEEFQQLLNKEYERLRMSRGEDEVFETPAQSFFSDPVIEMDGEMLSEFEKMLLSGTRDPESEATLALNKNRIRDANKYIAREAFEGISGKGGLIEPTMEIKQPGQAVADEMRAAITSDHKRRLEAMAKAREAYFASLSGEDYSFKSSAGDDAHRAPETEQDESSDGHESAATVSDSEPGVFSEDLKAVQTQGEDSNAAPLQDEDGDLGIPREPEDVSEVLPVQETDSDSAQIQEDASPDAESSEGEEIAAAFHGEEPADAEDETIPIDEYFALEGEGPDNSGKAAAMNRLLAEADRERDERPAKSHTFLSFIIVVILIFVLAEGVTIGLRHFAPESPASAVMTDAEQKVIAFFSKGLDAVKGIFIKNDSDEIQEPAPEDKNNGPANASFNLSALVEKYNKNIEKVVEDLGIGYDSQREYGVEGLAGSTLLDNIVEKEKIFATLIAYNSSWIDYVHSNGKECLDYLKADGSAYRSAVNFDKVGLIEEKFDQFSIGEIRVNGDFYYVFAREQISVTSEGSTVKSDESLIYQLVKVGDTLKIKDYYIID